jgi:acetyl-CoA synthetase
MHYPYQLQSLEQYKIAYKKSIETPEIFWSEIAAHFTWKKNFDSVLHWNFTEPKIEWFKGGKLNITENCLDRHIPNIGNKPAIIWEPNNPAEPHTTLTYTQLHQKVCVFAQVLKNNGVQKGDRVCIYMGMIPELAIAVLACARIGAIHSVVFGGFSAQSVADRIEDATIAYVITCDGAFRGTKEIPLKPIIDEALSNIDFVKKVIVFKRTNTTVAMQADRDVWWHNEVEKINNIPEITTLFIAETMDSEDPLFILYTSGSTGKPKGVVHSTAGYMVYTNYTFVNVFQYKPEQVFFCTADVGWITGHSYIIYGPLSAGATSLMFEGIPTYPNAGRFWDIVQKHHVNILYTAPTAIRSLMTFGDEPFNNKNLTSLQVLGTVGEPINEEAWHWYNEKVGNKKCAIVDTWWQSETGGILISNMANIMPSKPCWATLPMPGVLPLLVDEQGNKCTFNDENIAKGNLVITQPWPSILRTTYGNHQRCKETYFVTYPNYYFTGDGALMDAYGNFRITGRVDDVLNVSGHRIGTAEVENAINSAIGVVESAVVGFPHNIKGQGIYAYVITHNAATESDKANILQAVTNTIGAIAKPDKIQFVSGLPKTRSGKIMRRILRKIAEGDIENLGDTSTLLDQNVVDEIKQNRV